MRCNNCGWDNEPNAVTCIKCGHPLQSGNHTSTNSYNINAGQQNQSSQQPRPTVVNAAGMQPQGQQPQPKPTVIGSADITALSSHQGKTEEPRPTRIVNNSPLQGSNPKEPNSCPNCGYPVVGDFTSCPNCGTPMNQNQSIASGQNGIAVSSPAAENSKTTSINLIDLDIEDHVKCQKCGTEVSTEFSFCPKCGERIHLPTVRAIRHKPLAVPEPPKPHCTLELILEDEEVTTPRKNEYDGDSIILNRENTEPDNRTITSKEQAELSYEDGKWFVVNKSELGSTYIEVNRKMEVLPGDVIVMGDRRFKFETE